jgi:hypothetical protein
MLVSSSNLYEWIALLSAYSISFVIYNMYLYIIIIIIIIIWDCIRLCPVLLSAQITGF